MLLCLLLAILGTGCSSKQASLGGSMTEIAGAPLSERERAVLDRNQGTIARSVPDYARPLVDEQVKFYLRGGRKTVAITSQRAEKYLAYTKGVFRSYNLPEELAYLALVESGYNTTARSRAGAAGAWQFMPFTGMKFGLKSDKWQEQRHDIYQATHAAAEYLKMLYGRFGDWPTAIAAYNAGEGKMGRALEASGEKTYFAVLRENSSLDSKTRLRPETCQYVPRFLAMVAIMENLEELGFEPIHPESQPVVARVRVAPRTDLKELARASGLSWSEFQAHNAHYLKTVSHASQPTNAYVPVNAFAKAQAFARTPGKARVQVAAAEIRQPKSSGTKIAGTKSAGSYTLRPGDTMSKVARDHKTTVEALLAANNLKDAHNVRAGQTLRIPSGKVVAQASGKTATRTGTTTSYMVQPNDNLWQISRKLRCSVDELKRWNNLKGQDIQVGQRLIVMR